MVKIICGSWTEVYFTYHNILPPEAYSSVIFGGLQTRAAVTHSGCRHCPSQWGGGGRGGVGTAPSPPQRRTPARLPPRLEGPAFWTPPVRAPSRCVASYVRLLFLCSCPEVRSHGDSFAVLSNFLLHGHTAPCLLIQVGWTLSVFFFLIWGHCKSCCRRHLVAAFVDVRLRCPGQPPGRAAAGTALRWAGRPKKRTSSSKAAAPFVGMILKV